MGGAIIYLVIVAVWAVVLVPRWLRSHDHAPAESAVAAEPDGRLLARRSRALAASDTEEPPAAPDHDEAPAPAPRTLVRRRRSYDSRARTRRTTIRRRVVFGLLLLAIAGCSVAAATGYLPWWSVGAPVLLLPVYVVHVRRLIVAEHARRRRAERVAYASERSIRPCDDQQVAEPASMQNYRRRRTSADQAGWQPRPVPLPTYLEAPAVPRSYQSTVSVDRYDEESAPADDADVHDIRRAVGG